jgi:hypothetical protein
MAPNPAIASFTDPLRASIFDLLLPAPRGVRCSRPHLIEGRRTCIAAVRQAGSAAARLLGVLRPLLHA